MSIRAIQEKLAKSVEEIEEIEAETEKKEEELQKVRKEKIDQITADLKKTVIELFSIKHQHDTEIRAQTDIIHLYKPKEEQVDTIYLTKIKGGN